MISDEEVAAELTSIYRTPTGTMVLRPLQGCAVLTSTMVPTGLPGLFTNLSVGLGKSLLAAILVLLHGGERPVVITESSNIPQMRMDFESYRGHFRIPTNYRLVAWEVISSPTQPRLLEDMNPTCVVLDEGHKGKHRKRSARARRIDRHRRAHPGVPYFVMSGSPGAEFKEWAHQVLWALPHLATDRGGRIPVNSEGEPDGPAFRDFCEELDNDPAAHASFHDWLREQAGVLISAATYTDTPLRISHVILRTPLEMERHWENLREFGEAPDGWVLDGPGEQWMLARCMSNGMYYEHNPRPPQEYRDARKAWYSYVRAILKWSDAPGGPYDTEGQVANAVNAGALIEGRPILFRWLEQKPTYQPVTTTTWLSEAALEFAREWGLGVMARASRESGGGIVWVAQTGLGEELARRTGWPFYGDGARNARRQHVSLADRPGTPPVIICSQYSCGTGKNLQHRFSRALFMSPHSNNEAAEQNIGREHRPGQLEGLVEVTYLYGCLEDWLAMAKAERQAEAAERDLTSPRKLRLAEHVRVSYPDVDTAGAAWSRGNAVAVVVPENEK